MYREAKRVFRCNACREKVVEGKRRTICSRCLCAECGRVEQLCECREGDMLLLWELAQWTA